MKLGLVGSGLSITVALSVWACSTSNPARPSMSFTAPTAQQPANGIVYKFTQQPIAVSITNVVRTGSTPVTYSLEVAGTSAFTSVLVTRDGIAEGSGGTTSVTLPQLPGNATYYWRWRAVVDGIAGERSATQNFFVQPDIVIGVPAPQQPTVGSETFTVRPAFVVSTVSRTGPVSTISYDFEVASSSAFSPLVASATVPEQSGSSTSWTPTVDLPEGTIFWRVRAKDVANGITGQFSSTLQFQRKNGIDITKVVVAFGPSQLMTWPQTAKLTNAYFDSGDSQILCTEYDDPGWPETEFFGGPATVYSNQVVFVNHDGVWYAGVAAWMRAWPQFCKRDYDQDFFKDSLGGVFPFNGTVLHTGDMMGVMISSPARAWPDMKTVDQRSNIVMIAWPPGR